MRNWTTSPLQLAQVFCAVVLFGLVGGGTAWGQAAGDYRSIQSGNWSSTGTWERFNGASWVAAGATPTSLDGQITIRAGHTVTVAASVTADQVVVQAGGQITVNNAFILTIANGAGTDLDVFGTVNVAGTLAINAGAAAVVESGGILQNSGAVNTAGTLTFATGGKYQHTYTTSAGMIPTAMWNAGSTCEINGYTTYNTANSPPGGLAQNFYNFTWNCPAQTGTITLHGNIATVNGDFTVLSTGSGTLMARQNGDGTTLTLTIGGNLNLQGGTLDANNGTTAATINLGGSYNETGGAFLCSGAGGLALNFTGINKTLTQSAGAINTANMSFTVNSVASLTLNNGLSVATGQNFTVNNNGTLNCGTNVISGAGTFTLSSGGTLGLGDPNCVSLSGATGNIQTTTRSLTAAATYLLNGTVPQFVGVGLSGFPVSIQNLTMNNSAGVTLGITMSVYGTLTLSSGVLNTGTNLINVTATGAAAVSGGSSSSYVNGTLQKAFGTAGNPQSFTFPIGDASNYAPITLTSLNVTTAGSLTAKTAAGEHPNVSTSGINANKDVTRYWTLTNSPSGIAVSSYSAAFNFVSGDVDAGANTGNFVVRRYAGSWSTTTTGARNATSTQATGLSAFGDFAVGEPAIDHYVVTAASPQTAGTAFNTTVTAQDIFNQTVPDSTTIVTLSSSTGNAQFDSNGDSTFGDNTKTLSNGAFTISTKDVVAETMNLIATDSNSKTGTRIGVVINPTAPNRLAFTGQPQNTTAGATMAGVVVQVQDQFGNNLSRGGTNVSLTLNGGGTLNGTTTVATAANGSATFSTLSITNAGSKTLTASNAGLTSATSSSFTINPAPASAVRVETAADGSGTVVPAQNVTAGNLLTVYAITRDVSGNFVANVAAGAWSLPAKAGGVMNGDLAPAPGNKSAVFTGRLTGTATVRATSGALATTDSGTLTVVPGPATNLFLTLPGQTFTNGIANSGTVSNQTAGTPFNIVQLTATDPFTNIVTSYSGAKTISYSGPSGSPTYTTSVTFTSGQSSNTLATTLLKAETTTITATDGTLAGIPSSSLTVNPGAFAKLQLLMPGETAAPGSASGKTGTPAAQTVGTVFNVTVNAVDANWNLIGTNDTVAITSSDSTAILPANAALSSGTQTLGVTFETAGSATVTAGDLTHAGITADTGSTTAVNPGNQTITFSSPGNQTYGVAPITLGATASSGLTVSYSVMAGPATVSGNTLTITGAGSVTIQASQAGNANWNPATPVNQSISVAQKPLTGSITANNKPYDDSMTATIATRALPGVINSDVVSLTSGTAAFADKNVGNGKTVTATGLSLSGADAGNYLLASSTATTTANITAAGLMVSGVTASNKVYDGNTSATLNVSSAALVGVAGGDTVTLNTASASGVFADKAVGNGKTVSVSGLTLGGADAANYTLTQPTTTANITAKGLTVTGVTAGNKVYDGTSSATLNVGSAALVGVAVGDTVTLNTGSASGVFADKTVGNGKTVSVSGLTLSGADAANYTLTQPSATANITAKGLTVAVVNQTKVYGATNPVLTASYSGFVAGENASVLSGISTLSTSANTNSPVAGSPYPITIARGTLSAANYSFTFVDGTLTVSQAELIARAEDQSRVYGTTNPVFTINYSGFVNGETAVVIDAPPVASTLAETNSPTGTYPIILSGGSHDNYSLTLSNGTLTVTAAALTITADDQTKVYGQANPAFTVRYSGFIGGQDSNALSGTLAFNTPATSSSPAGTYPIHASGLSSTNYTISFVDGTLTVNKAPLTASADNQSRVYGLANPALTISYFGFVNGDTAAMIDVPPVANTTATATSNAGTYPITLSGGSDDNYALTLVDGTLTVTAAPPPTITGQPQNLTVNLGGTAQFNVTATGAGILIYQWLFNDNPIAGATTTSLVITNAQASNAGTYSVVVDNGSQTTSSDAVLKVNQPPTLAAIPNQSVNELTTLTVVASAIDPEAGPLTYQLTQAPVGAAINGAGVVSWTPTEAQGPSTNTFTVQVADNGTPPLTDSRSFTVVVNEVNTAPVLTVPASQTVRVGATMTVTNTTADADIPANLLTFSLVSAPAGMVINSTTGVITWTPPVSEQSSTNIVTVRVTDSGQPPLSDTKSFTVIAVGVGQRITAIQPTNGVIVLTLEGIPGETYHIQASPTLNPPIPWSVIGTNIAGTDAMSQFIDTDASLYPIRFYRSVKP